MRVAIVGCGRAGVQHSAAVTSAGGQVVAVCDADPLAARTLSSKAQAPSRELSSLLGDPAVEVVAVCTPPHLHLSLGLRAIAAGKAVVIEKPPALSREGIEELEAASRQYGLPIAVMFQHRGRLPSRSLLSDWSAQTSAVVEVFRHRPAAHYGSGTWRGDLSRSGGGFFAHLAIHYADLACQLLGEPDDVHAVVEAGSNPGVDVRVVLSVRMASGAFLTLHASSLPTAREERLRLFDGSRSLVMDNRMTRYVENGCEVVRPAAPVGDLRAMVYGEVAEALLSGKPVSRFGAGASAGSIALLERVMEALATRKLGGSDRFLGLLNR